MLPKEDSFSQAILGRAPVHVCLAQVTLARNIPENMPPPRSLPNRVIHLTFAERDARALRGRSRRVDIHHMLHARAPLIRERADPVNKDRSTFVRCFARRCSNSIACTTTFTPATQS